MFVLGLVQAGNDLSGGEEMSQHEDKSRAVPDALADEERERLDRIRTAIADGTYHISADDVALKLIRSMLEFNEDPPLHRPSSS
jgi:anti-sigma28 factor (negative regulator of flagellin synthesis)